MLDNYPSRVAYPDEQGINRDLDAIGEVRWQMIMSQYTVVLLHITKQVKDNILEFVLLYPMNT